MADSPAATSPTLVAKQTNVRRPRWDRDHPRYKWVALSNTTWECCWR